MPALDPCEILGLWPGASEEQIRRAYRRAVKKYHPDLNRSSHATEEFLKIQMAYELLIGGSGGKATDDVIKGDGWSASRSTPWPDFAENAASPRKVRVARNTTSVSSPFYRKEDGPIRFQGERAIARRQFLSTVWKFYLTIVAALALGFLGQGLFAIATGHFLEGSVTAAFGLVLFASLMIVIRIGQSAGFTGK